MLIGINLTVPVFKRWYLKNYVLVFSAIKMYVKYIQFQM